MHRVTPEQAGWNDSMYAFDQMCTYYVASCGWDQMVCIHVLRVKKAQEYSLDLYHLLKWSERAVGFCCCLTHSGHCTWFVIPHRVGPSVKC